MVILYLSGLNIMEGILTKTIGWGSLQNQRCQANDYERRLHLILTRRCWSYDSLYSTNIRDNRQILELDASRIPRILYCACILTKYSHKFGLNTRHLPYLQAIIIDKINPTLIHIACVILVVFCHLYFFIFVFYIFIFFVFFYFCRHSLLVFYPTYDKERAH